MNIEQRLEDLERNVAALKASLNDLRVARLRVKADRELQHVADLSMTDEGAMFTLQGRNTSVGRVQIVSSDRDHLLMFMHANRPRITMSLSTEGEPRLTMTDSNGVPRLVLGVLEDGPALVILDEKGTPTRAIRDS